MLMAVQHAAGEHKTNTPGNEDGGVATDLHVALQNVRVSVSYLVQVHQCSRHQDIFLLRVSCILCQNTRAWFNVMKKK